MKKQGKKLGIIVMMIILAVLPVAGCKNKDYGLSAKEPVTITMWHNYGGTMQESVDKLIDKFNSTMGKDKGIIINVTAITSSSELQDTLEMIVNGDPGAPDMPDICTAYPKTAILFKDKNLIADLDNYFTKDELDGYVDAFVEEGRIGEEGLYVFPVAKSTEILYLNRTLFDKFAAATKADIVDLETMEGIRKLAKEYYTWTDNQTPDTVGDGKAFFAADSWVNVAQIGMQQRGENLFSENKLDLKNTTYEYIWDLIYGGAAEGGFAVYDGYSSDLSKTGDVVCSLGSSAGVLFYGNTITYADGRVEETEYNILPYPVFENGKKIAIQRGNGMMVAKSEEKKEYAASVFIKWLTKPEQNLQFISQTGYLPVTKEAFKTTIAEKMDTVQDKRIAMMLKAVTGMYDNYEFYIVPTYADYDAVTKKYGKELLSILNKTKGQQDLQNGQSAAALEEFRAVME